MQLVAGALIADASAGWYNASREGFVWLAAGDRALAALAIVLVGTVTVHAAQQAHKAREFADRSARSEVMRDLIFALAHDLRTPLAAARMTLRQAFNGAYGDLPASYRDVLKRSITSNETVIRLADTLVTMARYEAGDQSAFRQPVDMNHICREVAADVTALSNERETTLIVVTDEQAVTVLADDADMRRAITNLVANAIANTPRAGTISISAERAGRCAIVRVADDGYGVAPELREHLFERFVSRSGRAASTGLGLYIVRRIVEAHSGSISYEPRTPSGSIFTVTLPLHAEVPA
ncbi:MAG TPA: HAMP domain-containing sensor histidine kinase [Candidatus Baltobacteraceae bacterium]